jgi:hypothetical protein
MEGFSSRNVQKQIKVAIKTADIWGRCHFKDVINVRYISRIAQTAQRQLNHSVVVNRSSQNFSISKH